MDLVSKAMEFVEDLVGKIKFPADGKLIWSRTEKISESQVMISFFVELVEKKGVGQKTEEIYPFTASCNFGSSGLCMVQVFGTKNGHPYDVIALFRDQGESRQFELHEPMGHVRHGFYPVAVIS